MQIHMRALLFAGLALASGCANFNSIHRDNTLSHDKAEIVFTDAKQRGVISNPIAVKSKDLFTLKDGKYVEAKFENHIRMCSEAAPDVFSAYAFSAAAKAAAKVAEKSGEGEFSLSSVENASTIARTQTINMLRESMFRTCERYLNGAIDRDELVVQAARDQRVMVSILAIEQLTGVYTPAVTALTASATSSTSGATAETIKYFTEAKKAAETAEAAAVKAEGGAKEAKDAADKTLPAGKDCKAVLADESITGDPRDNCEKAQEKEQKAKELREKAKSEKDDFERIKKLTEQVGGTSSSTRGGAQFNSAQSQAILTQNIEKVASAVENIVAETFLFDELKMTCVIALRKALREEADLDDNLLRTCVDLLGATVNYSAARVETILGNTYKRETADRMEVLKCAYPLKNGSPQKSDANIAKLVDVANGIAKAKDGVAVNLFAKTDFGANRSELEDKLKSEDPTYSEYLSDAARIVCKD